MSATILITGGTGLIGKALARKLTERGDKVIVLSRNAAKQASNSTPLIRFASWDVKGQTYERKAFEEADAIIHLAGAGVADKRWTKKRKKEILESRTEGSALILKALSETPNKIQTIISASGIGWYGEDSKIPNPRPFVETDEASGDFLGETCLKWEESIRPVSSSGKRLVILRTGIVLSNEGGALPEFKRPLHFGAAGILGSGKQVISWIHIDDLCRIYMEAIENATWNGVYNAVAPKPVSNKELTIKLAGNIKGRFYVPLHIPVFALKLFLGEMSVEVLKSTTVNGDKIRIAGYNFIYPSIDAALHELTGG